MVINHSHDGFSHSEVTLEDNIFKKKKVSIYKFPYWGVDANHMYAVTKGRTITDLDRTPLGGLVSK